MWPEASHFAKILLSTSDKWAFRKLTGAFGRLMSKTPKPLSCDNRKRSIEVTDELLVEVSCEFAFGAENRMHQTVNNLSNLVRSLFESGGNS